MNVGKLKGPVKMLQMMGKSKLQECKSGVLLHSNTSQADTIAHDMQLLPQFF
jgi:hypothetical protein